MRREHAQCGLQDELCKSPTIIVITVTTTITSHLTPHTTATNRHH
jgi:hypothetical protein